MLFNSLDFAVFLPIVFILYWYVFNKTIKSQNLLILFSSYLFYGWWDWRFLSLILLSSLIDFVISLNLHREKSKRKRRIFLWISILFNLGTLGFFKYFNFFLDSFDMAFSFMGIDILSYSLNILLPVGISFYTFQTLSYTIDVYRRQIEPTGDFIAFSAFVCFFPQLVAGPIERATNLLPQFYKKRNFNYSEASDGMRQILWGLFMKIVIADNCAGIANQVFDNSENLNGSTLLLGALFFTFQIYGDFAGYSNIAIGTARMFGFQLMQNFNFPYFSRDIAEFWRRWHISLSTWFRDYLYIPLGGSRVKVWLKVRNTFIIFILSGFWHGANWTFLVWGLLNAIYFLPILLTKRNRDNLNTVASGNFFPSIKEFLSILLTFSLTVIAWIFFRANNIKQATNIIFEIFSNSILITPNISEFEGLMTSILLVMIFIIIEWLGREGKYGIENLEFKVNKPLRWLFYCSISLLIIFLGGKEQTFIYFQF